MKKLLFALALISAPALAQFDTLEWSELNPQVTTETVVLPEINDIQKRLLSQVLHLQSHDDAKSQQQLSKLVEQLQQQGVDVEQALDLRARYMVAEQTKAETLNTKVDDTQVRMMGFVIPITYEGVKATEFLLVPTAGACIHMPPPPANQIVKLSYPQGFEVENMQYPVWVEGTINHDIKTEEVYLVDGKMQITMGYKMSGHKIEHYYK